MKLCLLTGPVFVLLLVPCADGQQMCGVGDDGGGRGPATNVTVTVAPAGCDRMSPKAGDVLAADQKARLEIPLRADILRRISAYEDTVRRAEAAHVSDAILAKGYANLGSLYEDAALFGQSEAAFEHSILLLRQHPESSDQLAWDLEHLGFVDGVLGKTGRAEKELLEAVRLQEKLGNSIELARSWNSLAGLYFKEGKVKPSRDFARKALDEFSVNKGADVVDRISSRFNLSLAMCYLKDCPSAIPMLKDAVAMAKLSFKENDFPIGEGEFLLGFAYWKSGDVAGAYEYMRAGTDSMKEQLGWGHPTYLNALGQYAKFLHDNRRVEDAEVVERQIRRAEAVVDVRSLPTKSGTDSFAGLR
jgi:tetratricopeptide (TPR) repeat protein